MEESVNVKNSKNAEYKILITLTQERDALSNYAEMIREDEFTDKHHRKIFRCLKEIHKDSFVMSKNLLLSRMIENKVFEDESQCSEMVDNLFYTCCEPDEFTGYLDVVRTNFIKARLLEIGNSMSSGNEDKVSNIISDSMDELVELQILQTQKEKTELNGKELLSVCLGNMLRRAEDKDNSDLLGSPTAFYEFDQLYGGFKKTDFVVIAARPSMGKTSFALTNVAYWVLSGKKVIFFSLEMPKEQLMYKLFSVICNVTLMAVMTGKMTREEMDRISYFAANAASILESNLVVDDKPAIKPSYMRRVCAKHAAKKKIDFIVCDYLQLMKSDGDYGVNKVGEVTEISNSSKRMAKEFDTVVIQLSQLNRELEKRADKRPIMSDLRDSGAIEQDADGIIFIYRDVVYDEKTENPDDAEIIIGKNRSGSIGTVVTRFEGRYTRFACKTAPIDYYDMIPKVADEVLESKVN